MNQPSREQIEARITALLLGELPAEEAELLRWTISQDAELQKLENRLKIAVGLVRETMAHPAEVAAEKTAPRKLSDERRRVLLAYFKTPRPRESFLLKPIQVSTLKTFVYAALALLLLAGLAVVMTPNFIKARATSQSNSAINNLRQIDAAKNEWALEKNKSPSDVPTEEDLKPYLYGGKLPAPVMGEKYVLGPVSQPVTADIDAKQAKKSKDLAQRLPSNVTKDQVVQLSADGSMTVVDKNAFQPTVGWASAMPPHKLVGDAPVSLAMTPPPVKQPPGLSATTPAPPPQPVEIVLPRTEPAPPAGSLNLQGGTGFAIAQDNIAEPPTPSADSFATGSRGGGMGGGGGGNDNGEAYVVKSGDTLTKIAREHGTTVQALQAENNLSTTKILAGGRLKIPGEAEVTTPSTIPADSFATGNGGIAGGFAIGGGNSGGNVGGGQLKAEFQNEIAHAGQPVQLDPNTGLPLANPGSSTAAAGVPSDGLNLSTAPVDNGGLVAMDVSGAARNLGEENRRAAPVATPSPFFNFPSSAVGGSMPEEKDRTITVSPRMAGAVTVDGKLPAVPLMRHRPVGVTKIPGSPAPIVAENDIAATTTFAGEQAAGISGEWKLQPQPAPQVATASGVDRIPFLGDMPLAGRMFQSASQAPANPAGAFPENAPNVALGLAVPTATPPPSGGTFTLNQAQLSQTGSSTLALNGDNSFIGGTTANGGSTPNRTIINNGTLSLDDKTISGAIQTSPETTKSEAAGDQIAMNYAQSSDVSKELQALQTANGPVVTGSGKFYNGVTRDDVNGLRYFTSTNAVALADSERLTSQRNLRITDGDFQSTSPTPTLNQNELRRMNDQLIEGEAKLAELQAMQETNPAQLRDILPTIVDDKALADLSTKLHQTEQSLAQLKTDYAPNNPDVLRQRNLADELNRQINSRVAGVMADLSNQAKTMRGSLDAISNQIQVVAEMDKPLPKPPVNAPVPQPEIQTRDNAFSTFSLNVSDVSFKLAAASLEQGRMPDAASIRSEEFINAFNYRDPEAAAGQPLAFASEQARDPFAHNRDFLRFSVKTGATGRQEGRALNLVLLLDTSGSMERADRVLIIREALRVLAAQLQPQDTVSVVTFARTARLWADGVPGDQAGATLEKVGGITPEGGTNLEEAMRLAYETAHRHYLAQGVNRVVLLTDGAANLGNADPNSLRQKVEAERRQGIALDCFGIGWEDFDDTMLAELSGNGDGRYAFINSPEEAGTEFAAKLAGALQVAAQDVKVQVEFNPQRVVSWRQIGYAKHQLTKEQFRDNSVLAAEIAAQEAGNALYTVETKPDGLGPVATVYVRYRVPGTPDVREHSWTVDYDGTAPALEQSSPAMRLTATAAEFSEWLADSPFAQDVTPDELLQDLSGVPAIYGADPRPQQLETMIREAKSVSGK